VVSLRTLPALAGAAVVAALSFVIATGLASLGHEQAAAPATTALPRLADAALAPTAARLGAGGRELDRALAVGRAQRAAHARTLELRRLRRSHSVRAALRRMWLAGAIDRARYEAARATLWRAGRTLQRLGGARAGELAAALAVPERLAARRLLTSSRLPLVLLTVARNARFWASRPFPAGGERVTFGSDPVVFRYEPGQGLQVHMLGTAARAPGGAPTQTVRAWGGRSHDCSPWPAAAAASSPGSRCTATGAARRRGSRR
jgi:hypothetical protein